LTRSSARAAWLLVCLGLTHACSLRSLEYLESGEASGGDAAGSGAAAGAAGVSTGGSASGAGGADVIAGTGTSEAGAAGSPPDVPDCADSKATLDETDIDCGGRTCAPCADDKKCITGTDCQSAICTNQVCQPPTCNDLAVNGTETDRNCGGTCPKCDEGMHCLVNADCVTNECTEGVCTSTTCSDDRLQVDCPLLVDNTPYSLAPAHALGKCIDDSRKSVAEGTAMVLYTCKAELHQTFWAVAQADGYFALRNALSGKCLQVRGASMSENAVIEQSTCDYAPEQLWKPSIVDATFMQLASKLSGLALDVAGSSVASDGQPIVQGDVDGGPDTHWRVVKRKTAAYIALSPLDDPDTHIWHDGSNTTLSSEDDDESSHWKVVPGLQDPAFVSFQSRDEPGRYLRHAGFRVWSDTNDGSTQFKRDATFRYINPFVGSSSMTHGLESFNYAGHALRRNGSVITLNEIVDTPEFDNDATWLISPR
jgi:hypothetical protein